MQLSAVAVRVNDTVKHLTSNAIPWGLLLTLTFNPFPRRRQCPAHPSGVARQGGGGLVLTLAVKTAPKAGFIRPVYPDIY